MVTDGIYLLGLDPVPYDLRRVHRETPPWDIGEAQPALLALLDEYPPTSPVLDVGCGTGALTCAVAQRGLAVLGVDLASAAIAQARARAATLPPGVGRLAEFRVGDALDPAPFPGPFGAVVDSGFFPPVRSGRARALCARPAHDAGHRRRVLRTGLHDRLPASERATTRAQGKRSR